MAQIELLILANSRKLGGRCVAGVDATTREWIRPVSAQPDGTVSVHRCRLNTGDDAALLDVVRMEVGVPRPEKYQPENRVLGDEPWHLVQVVEPDEAHLVLDPLLTRHGELLGNSEERIAAATFATVPAAASLVLIEPADIQWIVTTTFGGRRQIRAWFRHDNRGYSLPVTDPIWVSRLGALAVGAHPRAAANVQEDERLVLTVSLGEPLDGYCYKLVAGVIVLPQASA
jgi:hypothetical protein